VFHSKVLSLLYIIWNHIVTWNTVYFIIEKTDAYNKYRVTPVFPNDIQLFQLRLSPEQSGKVEYERERLLGISNKFIHLLAIPSSLSRSYSIFPLCSWDNLNWNSCILYIVLRYITQQPRYRTVVMRIKLKMH
jgi:predicted GNAT family acetyltransferase